MRNGLRQLAFSFRPSAFKLQHGMLAVLLFMGLFGSVPTWAADDLALPAEAELTNPAWARAEYAGIAQLYVNKTRYLLALDVDYTNGIIDGNARILFVNSTTDALTKVVFRLYPNHPIPLAYGSIYSGGKPRMTISEVRRDAQPVAIQITDRYQTVLEVPFDKPLTPGAVAEIGIRYKIQLGAPADLLDAREPFPLLAVYDGGTWRTDIMTKSLDYVYSETALFAVTIRAPNNLSLYNVGSITQTVAEGARVRYQITTGPVRDFVFQLARGWGFLPARGAPVSIDVRFKGRQDVAEEMANIAADAVAYYDKTFGPYFYAHLTLLAMVYPSGGEEFPTLLFIDNQRDTAYRRFIVAHEVAHQWFYGIAGNDVARHAWLDESLAQIALYLFHLDTLGTDAAEREWQFILTWANRLKGSPRLIDTPVESFADFSEYMVTNYGLGPQFLRELGEKMGWSLFKHGLAEYYQNVSLKVGTPAQFYEAMQAQVPLLPLAPLFCAKMGTQCPVAR